MDSSHYFPKKRHSTLSTFSPDKKFRKATYDEERGAHNDLTRLPISRTSAKSDPTFYDAQNHFTFSPVLAANRSKGSFSPNSQGEIKDKFDRFNKLSIDTYSSTPGKHYYDMDMPVDPPSPEVRIIQYLQSQNVLMSHPSMSAVAFKRKQSFSKCVNAVMGRRPSFLERRLCQGTSAENIDTASPLLSANPFQCGTPPK